jgi:hypothetical protein
MIGIHVCIYLCVIPWRFGVWLAASTDYIEYNILHHVASQWVVSGFLKRRKRTLTQSLPRSTGHRGKGRKGTEIQICQLEIALWSPGRKCCMYSASPWNYGWFTRGSNVRTDKLIWSDDNFLQKLHQVPSELERFLGYPTKQANEIWSHCNQVAKISQGASTSQIHLCTGHSHSSKVWLLRH